MKLCDKRDIIINAFINRNIQPGDRIFGRKNRI